MVGAAENELDFVGRYTTGLQQCCYRESVVFDTVFDELNGRLKVVEKAVNLPIAMSSVSVAAHMS